MKAKIRRANQNIKFPKYGTDEAAAFDFEASEEITIPAQKIGLVKTGLFIQCPENYFLAIFSRSSTAGKKGLSQPHGVGVLDRDYAGPNDEVLIMVYNFTDSPVTVKAGERIAQGIFLPTQRVEWEESETLRENSRGGFGSTGGYHP